MKLSDEVRAKIGKYSCDNSAARHYEEFIFVLCHGPWLHTTLANCFPGESYPL